MARENYENVSREELLAWVRSWAPDLRIGYRLIDGQRHVFARFTWNGEHVDLESDDDLAIARALFARVRALLGDPLLPNTREPGELEQQIIEARKMGDVETAKMLTAELVSLRTGNPNRPRIIPHRRERTETVS